MHAIQRVRIMSLTHNYAMVGPITLLRHGQVCNFVQAYDLVRIDHAYRVYAFNHTVSWYYVGPRKSG